MTRPIPLEDKYKDHLEAKKQSPETFESYSFRLANLPILVALTTLRKYDENSRRREEAFESACEGLMKVLNNHTDRRNVLTAFRSYIKFLKAEKYINAGELQYLLDTHKPEKRRGKDNSSGSKWSIPKEQWKDVIRVAPHKVARMGIWLGFNFGLRRGEIIHLRVQDVDFKKQVIHIQERRERKKNKKTVQKAWMPKRNRYRKIPFGEKQGGLLEKWMAERPELEHPYVLWLPHECGHSRANPVSKSAFRNWCWKVALPSFPGKLHPHILRYSFATHHQRAGMNLKVLSLLLGHSNVAVTSDYLAIDEEEAFTEARALMDA